MDLDGPEWLVMEFMNHTVWTLRFMCYSNALFKNDENYASNSTS